MITIYGEIYCGNNNQKYSFVERFHLLINYWHYIFGFFGIFMQIPYLMDHLVYRVTIKEIDTSNIM